MAYKGAKVNGFTTQFWLLQIIKEPTHILAKSSSCVELIFMSHQKLVIESGAHSSLHPNYHHHITYVKFDLKITTHQMNVKYGIMIKQMLIKLEKQLFYFPGKNEILTCWKRTDKFISSVLSSINDIARITWDLDPNKAHGHSKGIGMLKICGESISKPLEIIFKCCIKNGQFPSEWKKAVHNVMVPVHKKGDEQVSRNYWSVSLPPVCGKIFEHLIYNNLFQFFIKNGLISSNQCFKQGESYVYISFYPLHMKFINRLTTVFRGIFLGIFKAFDKVWCKGLILN